MALVLCGITSALGLAEPQSGEMRFFVEFISADNVMNHCEGWYVFKILETPVLCGSLLALIQPVEQRHGVTGKIILQSRVHAAALHS